MKAVQKHINDDERENTTDATATTAASNTDITSEAINTAGSDIGIKAAIDQDMSAELSGAQKPAYHISPIAKIHQNSARQQQGDAKQNDETLFFDGNSDNKGDIAKENDNIASEHKSAGAKQPKKSAHNVTETNNETPKDKNKAKETTPHMSEDSTPDDNVEHDIDAHNNGSEDMTQPENAADDSSTEPEYAHMGEYLALNREAQDLELKDVANRTRIPMHHLTSLEQGNYTDLPGRTYALGFAKTYARTLGLDIDFVADNMRAELDESQQFQRNMTSHVQEFEEPNKVPTLRIAMIAAVVGIAIIAASFFGWKTLFFPSDNGKTVETAQQADTAPAEKSETTQANAANAPNASSPVIFTSLEDGIWVKFYDGDGNQLMQKQMAKGETYQIPADAKNPQIWTGRPDAFEITVGGQKIAPLGTGETAIKDVPVSAEALLATSSDAASPAQSG